LSKTKLFGAACTLILLSILTVGLYIRSVRSESTTTIEQTIFSDSYYVASKQFHFSSIPLNGGTNVRIVFSASKPIVFYCQNSFDYDISNSTNWTMVRSEWNSSTSFLNRTYVIPTTDRWYFTFVNYENDSSVPPISIYYVALYRIDTYEIYVGSDKQSYSLGEEALLMASMKNDSNPLPGISVSLQVFDSHGIPINSQNNVTDSYGQVTVALILPFEPGIYNCVAKTSVAGNPIEDSVTFAVLRNSTLPFTFADYDGLWHTTDFSITLLAFDGKSGVNETYYRINNGPIQDVSTNGQPQITMEGANNTLEYWSTDNAGHEELPHNILTGIELDETPPNGSILVGNNATYVNSTSVTLALSAIDATSGVAQMHFSNDNVTWLNWENFSSSKNWVLASGDGLKTVYVQFRDGAGLVSDVYLATVTLDTAVPVIKNVSQIPENEVQPAQAATILANVTDSESGVKSVTLSYTVSGNNTWFESQMAFNSTMGLYEGTVPGQHANNQVEYRIVAYDSAGNEKIGDNQGQYYVYTVVPEFPASEALMFFIILTLLAVTFQKRFARENS
jgi:hypothetical protein